MFLQEELQACVPSSQSHPGYEELYVAGQAQYRQIGSIVLMRGKEELNASVASEVTQL